MLLLVEFLSSLSHIIWLLNNALNLVNVSVIFREEYCSLILNGAFKNNSEIIPNLKALNDIIP